MIAFHFPVRGKEIIKSFGDPIPHNDGESNEHFDQGEDPEEKFSPSKLENLSKRGHGIPFSPSAQTELNVGKIVTCRECHKPRLLYSIAKLKDGERDHLNACVMIFNLLVAQCFKKLWLTKITQMKLFYQKFLPVKISPAKVSLNCRITLAKHLSLYAFNVEKQVS